MKFYLFALLAVLFFNCTNSSNDSLDTNTNSPFTPLEFFGNTQGTTYAIICNDSISITNNEIKAILADFDMALSSYIDSSILTKLNTLTSGEFNYQDPNNYFNRCYEMSQEVYATTNGAFDPTVYPLVDGWGFMKDIENVPDSSVVDSLRSLVGFENGYHFTYVKSTNENGEPTTHIVKNTPGAQLDFNAIAQGLSVDVLAEELEKRGAKNYFVEIGGEIRVSGLNADGNEWSIGIDKPIENSTAATRELQEIVKISNKSIATSGSYRKFYEKNGIKYSHTLNPKTGYPVTHSLLSTTVVTKSCAMADAMATAFMVMGPQKSIKFIESHPELNLDVYLIFINDKDQFETYYTPAFGEMIVL